jgi:hypothetical protein
MCGELKALAQRFMHEMAKSGEFSRYVHAHIKVRMCLSPPLWCATEVVGVIGLVVINGINVRFSPFRGLDDCRPSFGGAGIRWR